MTMTLTLTNSHKEVVQGAPNNTVPTETAHHAYLQSENKETDQEVAIEAEKATDSGDLKLVINAKMSAMIIIV